jgi:hypothetical protein
MHTEPTSWHANWHRRRSDVVAARKKRHAPGRAGADPGCADGPMSRVGGKTLLTEQSIKRLTAELPMVERQT